MLIVGAFFCVAKRLVCEKFARYFSFMLEFRLDMIDF